MKVKTFSSSKFINIEEMIEKFLKTFLDLEIISLSHSSFYHPEIIRGGVPIGGYILYTAILIYK